MHRNHKATDRKVAVLMNQQPFNQPYSHSQDPTLARYQKSAAATNGRIMNLQDCYFLCTNSSCCKLIIAACNDSISRSSWISFWRESDSGAQRDAVVWTEVETQWCCCRRLHAGNKWARQNPFSRSHRGVKHPLLLRKPLILMRSYLTEGLSLTMELVCLIWVIEGKLKAYGCIAERSCFGWNLLSGTIEEKQAHASSVRCIHLLCLASEQHQWIPECRN